MSELPLHPALVHLPLGLVFALPMLGLGVMFAIIREWLPRTAWLVVVLVSALAFATALAARNTGEKEEHEVAHSVPRLAIHEHEEAADAFVIALGAMTLLSAASFFLRRPLLFRLAMGGLSLAYFGVVAAGFRAGRLGGELVYVHRAGALEPTAPDPGQPQRNEY